MIDNEPKEGKMTETHMKRTPFSRTLELFVEGTQKQGGSFSALERLIAKLLTRGDVPMGQGEISSRETFSAQSRSYMVNFESIH